MTIRSAALSRLIAVDSLFRPHDQLSSAPSRKRRGFFRDSPGETPPRNPRNPRTPADPGAPPGPVGNRAFDDCRTRPPVPSRASRPVPSETPASKPRPPNPRLFSRVFFGHPDDFKIFFSPDIRPPRRVGSARDFGLFSRDGDNPPKTPSSRGFPAAIVVPARGRGTAFPRRRSPRDNPPPRPLETAPNLPGKPLKPAPGAARTARAPGFSDLSRVFLSNANTKACIAKRLRIYFLLY
jgi:hypothetical protein